MKRRRGGRSRPKATPSPMRRIRATPARLIGHDDAEAEMLARLSRGAAGARLADRRPRRDRQGDARLAVRSLPVRQSRPGCARRARRARPFGRPAEPSRALSRDAGASGLLPRAARVAGRQEEFYSEIRVDDIRDALQVFQMSAAFGGWRVCLVDCAEDLNPNGANALLKMIEEPPQRSLILIVSHQPGRVLPTIRSRCRRLKLEPLSESAIVEVVGSLGTPWSDVDPAAVATAASRAAGSVREALRGLIRTRTSVGALIDATVAKLPHPDPRAVAKLAEALAAAPRRGLRGVPPRPLRLARRLCRDRRLLACSAWEIGGSGTASAPRHARRRR